MTIRAVLFDLDNTLTDRPRSIEIFAARFYDQFRDHLDSPLDLVTRVIVTGDSDGYRPKHELFDAIFTHLHWKSRPLKLSSNRKPRSEHPSILLPRRRGRAGRGLYEQVEHFWFTESPRCMVTREGVGETLRTLTARGIKLGLITNGQTTVQNATIDAIGIRPYMQTILVSETVGLRKPDAAIFHLALSHLEVAPHEAIFVGDHPGNDVHGARSAGLTAIWLSGCHDWPDHLAPPQFEIAAIPTVLKYLS